MLRTLLSSWPSFASLLLLAAGTISTKAAGAFWLSLVLIGIYYWLKKPPENFQASTNPTQTTLKTIAKGWLYFCLLALALKTIPMVYWSGPWEERHAEFRLLIGATASYLLIHYQRLPKNWFTGVGHALSVACVLAFGLASIWGSHAAPTNRIPWAAGVSILSCLLLTWSFLPSANASLAGVWRICSLLGVCAVLISGVRGSFALVLIWPALWWWQSRQSASTPFKGKLLKTALALLIATLAIAFAPRSESPFQRIHQVAAELGLTKDSDSFIANSSNGARIVLWKAGLQAFQNHWVLGLGFTGGKDLIKQAAANSQSDTVKSLGHFHNDYIHTAVEFGILGLLSFLGYSVGMAWCAWRLYQSGFATSATGMLAVLGMHMTTSLTNMNFAHNYYPTILSIGVSLLLLSAQHQSSHKSLIP
jgi:O-antigen ligase